MNQVITLARREFGAYFLSPIAYAVNAIFLFSAGLAFALRVFQPGNESSLRNLLEFWMVLILVFVLPMLTMRLMSEELRSGTIETLMTAPVTEWDVVLGKFTGAVLFYLVMLGALLLYPIVLGLFGDVDLKLLFCHYLGLLLLGLLYISVGLFFSTLTRHQVIAVLMSFALLALMTFAFQGLSTLVENRFKTLLQQLSIQSHFNEFVRGTLDLNHVVFFLTTTAFFLFTTAKLLETRRWH